MSKRTKLDTVGLQWPSKRVEALGERKFRDIVGILPRPGHLRDKAQISGTVGNYVYTLERQRSRVPYAGSKVNILLDRK